MDIVNKPQISISFTGCPAASMKRIVMTVFRSMGTDCTSIILKDASLFQFPVKAVDEYLRKHPEKVRKVTVLHLDFSDRINHGDSMLMLEMARKRFPNVKTLSLPQKFTHHIGHALSQYAQMPNLRTIHFSYNVNQLAEYAQKNDLIPLPQVKTFYSCMVGSADTYKDFEATLPIIFPNLESLHFPCDGDEFAEQIYANAKRLFPKMKLCKVVDSTDITAMVLEEDISQFPIKVAESLN